MKTKTIRVVVDELITTSEVDSVTVERVYIVHGVSIWELDVRYIYLKDELGNVLFSSTSWRTCHVWDKGTEAFQFPMEVNKP